MSSLARCVCCGRVVKVTDNARLKLDMKGAFKHQSSVAMLGRMVKCCPTSVVLWMVPTRTIDVDDVESETADLGGGDDVGGEKV